MSLDLYQVDAFTDRPFGGNPAAVCLLPDPREAEWMQLVAREMNLSETAFLHPVSESEGGWRLRWFTPAAEGGALRPRHPGECPRALGDRAPRA